MTWALNEVVRTGSSTALVKSYNPETNALVLYYISGSGFINGATIVGDDSGTVRTLINFEEAYLDTNNYTVGLQYETDEYTDQRWQNIINYMIHDGADYGSVADYNINNYPSGIDLDTSYADVDVPETDFDPEGDFIVIDEYFTGKPSQDYQTDFVVISDGS